MALFFSRILDRNKKNVIRNCIKFLSVSVIFSVLSFIEYRTKKSSVILSIKIELKNGLLLNSVSYLLITILYVYFNNF